MATSFSYGTQVCGSLTEGSQREWLVADGRGGYAMGTVTGLRTRRYHGLLVVSGAEPARRMMALAAADPVLTLPGGAVVRLGTHEWHSGAVEPKGYTLLESFEMRDGLPRWRWRVGEVVLERVLAMGRDRACVGIVHTQVAGPPVRLAVEPVCTWRDGHGERHAASGLQVSKTADGFVVEDAYRVAGPGFEPDGEWFIGTYHREEAARGLNASEDLYRVGRFTADLAPGETMEICAWSGDADALAEPAPSAREIIGAARSRAGEVIAGAAGGVEATLRLAADAFVVRTPNGPEVIAGYPWFGAWSRDTMISYEGLFLCTGRVGEGRELLRSYASTLSDGMLANTADTGRTQHNTADATLWFLHAVDRHIAATQDLDLAAELVGALDEVVRWHRTGTRYGIRVDPDGLLTQGADGYALTWMDAVIHGVPATPRRGKAVELNALWVNGLGALAALHERLGHDRGELDGIRGRAVEAFLRRFPAPQGWLYDVVDVPVASAYPASLAAAVPGAAVPGGYVAGADAAPAPLGVDDAALRPNQLLAFGLPYAPMRGSNPVPVRAVARTLLTPLGLRTLDPGDRRYVGLHRGDPAGRDGAYHQGTVWPWLIGPYADAAEAVGLATEGLLDGLVAHLGDWGIGSVSETADGDAPHAATGCPFQAWSVAETLRLVMKRPRSA
jgi:predicted glycogen debranching enzyme